MDTNKELELITMIEKVQREQHQYFKEKRLYGNSSQQLEKCKILEKQLKDYCTKRRKEIESKQQNLFT